MPNYAAFLRAVNLGSQRKVSSAQLRSLFEELGLEEVDAFRTSGNVVFGARREPVAKLRARIEKGLAAALGFDVMIFLRTAGQVRAIAEHEPFAAKDVEASEGKLQVALLPRRPAIGVRDEVLALATAEDRLAFGQRELYWLPRSGTQRAALDMNAIAQLAGPMTMRTKGTIEALAAKYFAG